MPRLCFTTHAAFFWPSIPEHMSHKVLIVEDEPSIQELLRVNLSRAGYETFQAADVPSALKILEQVQPALILVDWNLPSQSGLEFVKTLRRRDGPRLPIIMLSARVREEDKLLAFDAGVDDYVAKPFHARELLARVKAKILRFNTDQYLNDKLEIDGLAVYPVQQVATVQGLRIELLKDELALLFALMSKPQQVLGRQKLLECLHGPNHLAPERNVDAVVMRLRRKLEKAGHPPCLETVRSVGYRFLMQPEAMVVPPADKNH